MIWLIILITLASFIYLLAGRPAPMIAREEEARRLIAQYQEHHSIDIDHQAQQERDYRLYQELSALLSQSHTTKHKLSSLAYFAIPLAFGLSIFIWQWHSGIEMQRWQRLYQALNTNLTQHKIYGKQQLENKDFLQSIQKNIAASGFFAENTRSNNALLLYCQTLQRHIERTDAIQLDALGHCYSQLGLFELAEPVYERLNSLYPNSTAHILAWAQAKTLAHPEQAPPREVIQKLHNLIAVEPNNALALLFLASAYQQHGEIEQALPLWQQLLQFVPENDPLYPAISQAAAKAQIELTPTTEKIAENSTNNPTVPTKLSYQVSISIAPKILAQLPETARLFVIIAPTGEKIPLAVKMLTPQAEQEVSIDNHDSMTGATLNDYPQLTIRALLSPSGNVGDSASLSAETQPNDGQYRVQLHLSAP